MVARCSETNAWNGIRSFYRDLENSLECYSEDLPSSAKPMGHKVSSSVIQSINQLWLGLRFTLYSHFFSFLAFVCKGDGGGWFSLFSFTLLVIGRVRSRVHFPDSLFVLLVLQRRRRGGGVFGLGLLSDLVGLLFCYWVFVLLVHYSSILVFIYVIVRTLENDRTFGRSSTGFWPSWRWAASSHLRPWPAGQKAVPRLHCHRLAGKCATSIHSRDMSFFKSVPVPIFSFNLCINC